MQRSGLGSSFAGAPATPPTNPNSIYAALASPFTASSIRSHAPAAVPSPIGPSPLLRPMEVSLPPAFAEQLVRLRVENQKKDTQLADLRSQLGDAQKFRDQSAAARAQIAMFTDNFRVREADLLARLETARNEGMALHAASQRAQQIADEQAKSTLSRQHAAQVAELETVIHHLRADVESAEQGRKEAEYRLQLQSREQQLELQHSNVREHQSAVSRQAMADRLADVERERASLELRLGEETQQARALNERIRQLEAAAFDADAQRRRAAFDDAQRIAAAEATALQDAQQLSSCQQTVAELTHKCADAEKLIQTLQLEVAQCTQRADSMSVLNEPLQQQLTSEQQLRHSLELAAEAERWRHEQASSRDAAALEMHRRAHQYTTRALRQLERGLSEAVDEPPKLDLDTDDDGDADDGGAIASAYAPLRLALLAVAAKAKQLCTSYVDERRLASALQPLQMRCATATQRARTATDACTLLARALAAALARWQALSRNYAVLAERAAIGEHLFRGISDLQSAMADAAASVGSSHMVSNSPRRNFRFRAAVFAVLAANRLKQHDRCSWFGLGERLFGDVSLPPLTLWPQSVITESESAGIFSAELPNLVADTDGACSYAVHALLHHFLRPSWIRVLLGDSAPISSTGVLAPFNPQLDACTARASLLEHLNKRPRRAAQSKQAPVDSVLADLRSRVLSLATAAAEAQRDGAVLAQRCAQIASRADADAAAAAELQSIRLAEAEAKQREMTNEIEANSVPKTQFEALHRRLEAVQLSRDEAEHRVQEMVTALAQYSLHTKDATERERTLSNRVESLAAELSSAREQINAAAEAGHQAEQVRVRDTESHARSLEEMIRLQQQLMRAQQEHAEQLRVLEEQRDASARAASEAVDKLEAVQRASAQQHSYLLQVIKQQHETEKQLKQKEPAEPKLVMSEMAPQVRHEAQSAVTEELAHTAPPLPAKSSHESSRMNLSQLFSPIRVDAMSVSAAGDADVQSVMQRLQASRQQTERLRSLIKSPELH